MSDQKTQTSTSQVKTDETWVKKKLGHLLLHLYARERWKTDVVARAQRKFQLDGVFELEGVTDQNYPTNWGLTQEVNTIKFILGDDFDGSFKEALEAIREFVYRENTECNLQNNKSESPLKPQEDILSQPAQDQERPTPS